MTDSEAAPFLPNADPRRFGGMRVTVMGLGTFGGGLGAVQFLLDRRARVTVTDLRTREQLTSSLSQIDESRLERLVLGEHREQDFVETDLVVVNPAVRPTGNRYLELAGQAEVPLTSEINLFWQHCRGRIIGVTGTVGKSTTATLIHQCLAASGRRAWLGGNIGTSLLPEVDAIAAADWVVLELSSFQLTYLADLSPAPDVAVVTNLFPNHLDWHPSISHYREAKQALLEWQRRDQYAVLNQDDEDVRDWPTQAARIPFGVNEVRDAGGAWTNAEGIRLVSGAYEWKVLWSDIAEPLRHQHLRSNAAAAWAAMLAVESIEAGQDANHFDATRVMRSAGGLHEFQMLPHRLQRVVERDGRTFWNDSKATTPQAAIAAISSLGCPVVWIGGGKDKGVDLAELAHAAARTCRAVIVMGETASRLSEQIGRLASIPVRIADGLEDAVSLALQESLPGDAILLSPGCASDREFLNYEQRGDRFQQLASGHEPM